MRKFDTLAMVYRTDERKRKHLNPWSNFKSIAGIGGDKKGSSMTEEGRSISAQDRAKQSSLYDTAQGTYGQFEGPVTSSPFYKALLTSGTDAATTAGAGAKSASRARGKMAGFGYSQPAENVAESGIDASTASTLGSLPSRTAAMAAPLSLEAARGTESMGTELGREGQGYFSSVVPLEEQYQDQLFKQQQALWNAIAQVPKDLTAAAPFI